MVLPRSVNNVRQLSIKWFSYSSAQVASWLGAALGSESGTPYEQQLPAICSSWRAAGMDQKLPLFYQWPVRFSSPLARSEEHW